MQTLSHRLFSWWEDQHPLTHLNLFVFVVACIVWLILEIVVRLAAATLSFSGVFRVSIIERTWEVTGVIFILLLAFNALRLVHKAWQGHIGWIGVMVAWICVGGVALTVIFTPSFFKATVAHVMERPYSEVFDEYQTLCDSWQDQCQNNGCTTLQITDLIYEYESEEDQAPDTNLSKRVVRSELGIFADGERVEVFKEGTSIFFNFGKDELPFGLVCVIDDDTPPTNGARSNDFVYTYLRNNYYIFIEDKQE
jgi:hypothetical protein